jgi:hypothetical protein
MPGAQPRSALLFQFVLKGGGGGAVNEAVVKERYTRTVKHMCLFGAGHGVVPVKPQNPTLAREPQLR